MRITPLLIFAIVGFTQQQPEQFVPTDPPKVQTRAQAITTVNRLAEDLLLQTQSKIETWAEKIPACPAGPYGKGCEPKREPGKLELIEREVGLGLPQMIVLAAVAACLMFGLGALCGVLFRRNRYGR